MRGVNREIATQNTQKIPTKNLNFTQKKLKNPKNQQYTPGLVPAEHTMTLKIEREWIVRHWVFQPLLSIVLKKHPKASGVRKPAATKPPGSELTIDGNLTQWPNCGITITADVTWCYATQKYFFAFTYMGKDASLTLWIIFFKTSTPLRNVFTIRICYRSANIWKV